MTTREDIVAIGDNGCFYLLAGRQRTWVAAAHQGTARGLGYLNDGVSKAARGATAPLPVCLADRHWRSSRRGRIRMQDHTASGRRAPDRQIIDRACKRATGSM